MAVATYARAAEAGVDIIDTATAPISFSTSQPATETLVATFAGTEHDPKLDIEQLERVALHFDKIAGKHCIEGTKVVDAMVITHQIPGGMASNLLNQLREQRAEDRLAEVLEEVPRVREDLGYPPLVTPTSQIVGVQAVMNVLSGERYKLIPNEVRDYVKGLYGRSPAPVREAVLAKILGKEKPLKGRPADRLEPALPAARKELAKEYVEKEEDYISYALFPEVALKFFEWRKDPAAVEAMEKAAAKKTEKPAAKPEAKPKSRDGEIDVDTVCELIEAMATFDGSELEWDHHGKDRIVIRRGTAPVSVALASKPDSPVAAGPRTKAPEPTIEPEPEGRPTPTFQPATAGKPSVEVSAGTEEITSPMVGTFYLRAKPDAPAFIDVGDVIEVGQTFCIVEAMKLMNEIQAEKKCRIVDILAKDGDSVEYGQPLVLIEPL